MSTRGTSHTGSSSQTPQPVTCVTRSNFKNPIAAPPTSKAHSQASNKSKPATAGEQARQLLTDINGICTEENVTPSLLYKFFKRILDKYGKSTPEDLHLSLQAYTVLLQEHADSEHLTNKAINAVAS